MHPVVIYLMYRSYEIMLPGFTGCSVVTEMVPSLFAIKSHIYVKYTLKSLHYP